MGLNRFRRNLSFCFGSFGILFEFVTTWIGRKSEYKYIGVKLYERHPFWQVCVCVFEFWSVSLGTLLQRIRNRPTRTCLTSISKQPKKKKKKNPPGPENNSILTDY